MGASRPLSWERMAGGYVAQGDHGEYFIEQVDQWGARKRSGVHRDLDRRVGRALAGVAMSQLPLLPLVDTATVYDSAPGVPVTAIVLEAGAAPPCT